MIDGPYFVLAVLGALACGLAAGAFAAFSTFVMKGLAALPPAQGIAAMQAINVTAVGPWFMAVFAQRRPRQGRPAKRGGRRVLAYVRP